MSNSSQTYLVRNGFNTPDDRYEIGDTVKESEIPKKSLKWLLEDGTIELPSVEASDAARKLAEEQGIDLEDVDATGADGGVTKPDVEKAIAARAAVSD